MDTTATPKTMHLREAARQKLIEYATMQARTGLQMLRNSIETDPRLSVLEMTLLRHQTNELEDFLAVAVGDEIVASKPYGSPSTPSESAT